jgi:hypothetical protein
MIIIGDGTACVGEADGRNCDDTACGIGDCDGTGGGECNGAGFGSVGGVFWNVTKVRLVYGYVICNINVIKLTEEPTCASPFGSTIIFPAAI